MVSGLTILLWCMHGKNRCHEKQNVTSGHTLHTHRFSNRPVLREPATESRPRKQGPALSLNAGGENAGVAALPAVCQHDGRTMSVWCPKH